MGKANLLVNPAANWIANFGVSALDPGEIYVVSHNGRYKIGRSTNAAVRIREARTWLPELEIIGVKPFWNVRHIERCMHVGFARCWSAGEWFEMVDRGYEETFLGGFKAFSDSDRDRNSVDFIYWFNGDGMAEFIIEQNRQRLSVPKFLKQESQIKKV